MTIEQDNAFLHYMDRPAHTPVNENEGPDAIARFLSHPDALWHVDRLNSELAEHEMLIAYVGTTRNGYMTVEAVSDSPNRRIYIMTTEGRLVVRVSLDW